MMRMSSNGVVSSPTPIGPYSPVKNGRLNTAPSRQGTAMTEGSTMMVDNGPEGVWGKPSSPGGTVESPSRPSTQSRWMDRMMLESTRMLEPRGNSVSTPPLLAGLVWVCAREEAVQRRAGPDLVAPVSATGRPARLLIT